MACCRTPSSQSAPSLSLQDRTLPVLPCSCTHSEEPSEEALLLPSKPTPKSSLTDRRVHHSPGVSLPSSKAGKSSLLPSVKFTPGQHGSPNHHKATCAQLVWLLPGVPCTSSYLLWTFLCKLVSVDHSPRDTSFPVFKSSPPAGFPGEHIRTSAALVSEFPQRCGRYLCLSSHNSFTEQLYLLAPTSLPETKHF